MKSNIIPALLFGSALFLAAPVRAQYSNPIRDIDNGARQPFGQWNSLQIAALSQIAADTTPAVPAGKRLVIDAFSAYVDQVAAGGLAAAYVQLTTNGNLIRFHVPLTKSVNTDGTETWIGNFTAPLYADAGTIVLIGVFRTKLTNPSNVQYALSGHFVNLP